MAEPTELRLHNNQSFPDQLGYAVHQMAVQTMAHLKVLAQYWCDTLSGSSVEASTSSGNR
eukprot:scaffold53150_cov59-Attheya_sp.AAC.5